MVGDQSTDESLQAEIASRCRTMRLLRGRARTRSASPAAEYTSTKAFRNVRTAIATHCSTIQPPTSIILLANRPESRPEHVRGSKKSKFYDESFMHRVGCISTFAAPWPRTWIEEVVAMTIDQ
jgi:hypothetical protein